MVEITLDKAEHKGKQILLLKFPFNNRLTELTKQLPGAAWSRTYKSWYVGYSMEVLHEVKRIFNDVDLPDGEIVKIDARLLKEKLALQKNAAPVITNNILSEDALKGIEKFKSWMRSRRYSDNTIKTYSEALKTFLKFYNNKSLSEIVNEDIIVFNNEYILKNELSTSFQNQVVNAIKLFFKTVENRLIEVDLVHRPKRQKVLPNVLSKEEVKSILDVTQNLKHKAMLSLIYACGLRSGEILRLLPEHVDTKRMILIIKQGKGRKDRIAPLSSKIAELLRNYFTAYKPAVYLFEGVNAGLPYDARSLQNVLKQNLGRTKINRPVSLHWLRHSYATHLLENGTDLRYIQEILGHSSSKTTEIYTHVSNKSIQKIISPFDTL